ncbi:MAG: DegT/DnrJ/EryC1/StrS family aminotransferase [Acidobacteria bacterium]|nr:DegT/DnrJ/EryC1/StrS family aminotransferase [Acidobacteriota bacterium]
MEGMKVGFHGQVRQYHQFKPAIDAAIHKVLESGVYVLGPKLEKFERDLATYCRMQEAVGVNSGTDALWLVLKALDIGPGDEVILTANTYFATAEAIWIAGSTAVFVDIEQDTLNMDTRLIERAITNRTKAIIPVHLYGQPARMREVTGVAKKHNLHVVEDCAQAVGARGNDFLLGELSDAMCTSFTPQKTLGCYGDGGAVLTNHPDLAERLRKLRNHGSDHRGFYSMGYNSRLDEIHAAVLSVKIKQLDSWIEQRRRRAGQYIAGLAGTSLKIPSTVPGFRHAYQFFVVEAEDRDGLQAYLGSMGITAFAHHPVAIHQQAGFPWGQSARISGSLERTESSAARVLSLPLYPEITDEETNHVIRTVIAWDHTRPELGTPG